MQHFSGQEYFIVISKSTMKCNYIILEGTKNRNIFFLNNKNNFSKFFFLLYLRKGSTKKLIQMYYLCLKFRVCVCVLNFPLSKCECDLFLLIG